MKWTIKHINGNVLFEVEAETFLRAVEQKYANLRSADLRSADLSSANLRSADLRSANLRSADLSSANLSFAKTKLSNLLKSNSVATLLQQYWGQLPDDLCLEMMHHDAESCGIGAMNNWVKTDKCPFDGSVRDYHFIENKSLWKAGKPKLRGVELLKALWRAKGGEI
jgi:hypothetical protein